MSSSEMLGKFINRFLLLIRLRSVLLNAKFAIKRESCHHIESSQLICRASQLIGFYMMATLAFNELIHGIKVIQLLTRT